MVMLSSSSSRSRGHILQAIAMMFLLTFLSVLSLNVMGETVSFVFIPLIGVCLWPRGTGPVISVVVILGFGLLLDFVSFGPLGLWALIYLSIFALFRSHLRAKPYEFKGAFIRWLFVLVLVVIMSFLLAWFAMQIRPDILPLLYQALAATAFFPLIYGIRHIFRSLLAEPEDRGL